MQGAEKSLLTFISFNHMSKTYSDYLTKAQMLVAGLRKNSELVKEKGIAPEDVSKLESLTAEGEVLNKEVERMRQETSVKVTEANQKLTEIKDLSLHFKRIVKQHFDNTRWIDFGVPDKR